MTDHPQEGTSFEESNAGRTRDQDRAGGTREGTKERNGPDMLERVVSWASALLLLGAMAYLTWEGLNRSEPPRFEARVVQTWEDRGHHYVELSVLNVGDESVQAFNFGVELLRGDSTVARASGSLSWVPARSERRATVILDKDPRQYEFRFVPEHYEFP